MQDPQQLPQGRRARRPEPRRSFGLASALFYCALALVMVVVAVGTFLIVAAPVDILRDQLIAQVKARTGRDLTIAGRSSLSFYPSLGMSFSNVTLSGPPGLGGPPTVTMAGLEVTVSLAPLFSRQIEVQRLVLRQPVIHLRTDAQGRRSWDFAAMDGAPRRIRLAQATKPGTSSDLPKELQDFVRGSGQQQAAGGPTLLSNLKSGEVRIEKGRIEIADERTGLAERVSDLDMRISYRGQASPLAVAGQGLFRGEPLDVDLRIVSPDRILEGQSSRVDLTAKAETAKARFEGVWTPAPALAEGNVEIDAQSGVSLARLLRQPGLAAIASPIKFAGLVRASEAAVAFNNARLDIDQLNASGTFAVETAGTKPFIRANLRVGELDFNRLEAMAAAGTSAARAAGPTQAPANPQLRGIGDLIERTVPDAAAPGTKVKGFLKRADWSDAPIDFSSLALVDGDVRLAVSRIVYNQTKLGPAQTSLTLRSAVLRANFDDVQFYEGRARGIFTLDGSGRVPAFSLNLAADGISIQPFLRDVADNDRISGRGRLTLAVAGSGATERRIMQSLEGKGDMAVVNGSIAGLDAMQQVLGILQGRQGAGTGQTDFSELSGSVAIAGGVARNSDLKLLATGLRVGGDGIVDIGQRQIDYVFRPRADGVSLEVPVRARGPWDDVRYAAELNREKAMEALKEIGRQFNGQNVGEIIRGLTQPGDNGEPPKARQLLERFLKR